MSLWEQFIVTPHFALHCNINELTNITNHNHARVYCMLPRKAANIRLVICYTVCQYQEQMTKNNEELTELTNY